MSNASSISAFHALRRSSIAQESTLTVQRALEEPISTVIITSVQTDTVHPTWVYTETTTRGFGTPLTAPVPKTSSLSTDLLPSPHNTQQMTRSMGLAAGIWPALRPHTEIETSVQDPPPEPPVTSSVSITSSSQSPSSLLEGTSTTSNSYSSPTSSQLATATSGSQSSSTSAISSSQTRSTEQTVTASSLPSKPPPSFQSSTARDFPEATGSSAVTSARPTEYGHTHPSVGTIVGSVIGGAAFIALVLMACFLLFRRRRRHFERRRQSTRETLLRNSASTLPARGGHNRHSSDPTFIDRTPPHSPYPTFSTPRRYSIPFGDRLSNPLASNSNHNSSFGREYLRDEARESSHWAPSTVFGDPIADPEFSPVSPISERRPPSRTISSCSRSSRQGCLQRLQSYDPSTRGPRSGSVYYPGEIISSLTDPCAHYHDRLDARSRYLDTPMMRDSTRSDPFDLEPPPTALRKWYRVPPPCGENL